MVTTSLAERIEQSDGLIRWLDRLIEGLSIPTNDRAVIVAACQDVALEHHKSIVLTTREKFHGSAFALVRLQDVSLSHKELQKQTRYVGYHDVPRLA